MIITILRKRLILLQNDQAEPERGEVVSQQIQTPNQQKHPTSWRWNSLWFWRHLFPYQELGAMLSTMAA